MIECITNKTQVASKLQVDLDLQTLIIERLYVF